MGRGSLHGAGRVPVRPAPAFPGPALQQRAADLLAGLRNVTDPRQVLDLEGDIPALDAVDRYALVVSPDYALQRANFYSSVEAALERYAAYITTPWSITGLFDLATPPGQETLRVTASLLPAVTTLAPARSGADHLERVEELVRDRPAIREGAAVELAKLRESGHAPRFLVLTTRSGLDLGDDLWELLGRQGSWRLRTGLVGVYDLAAPGWKPLPISVRLVVAGTDADGRHFEVHHVTVPVAVRAP